MISWKHSFKRLSEEFEMTRKKKEALDNLLKSGRISQSTHELFNKEIDETVAEIEKQQKVLLDKMSSKISELEGQIKTLEILLANFEIQHVAGEIEEEVYKRETSLLSIGLETAKHELEVIREAMNQLLSETNSSQTQQEQPPQETLQAAGESKLVEESAASGEKQET